MTILIVLLCIAILIVLISVFKINAFISFLLVSFIAGLALGLPPAKIPASIEKGMGDVLGSLAIIITAGAMLGKLVAESGAAQKIAKISMQVFGQKYIQWAMVLTGFLIGIPLYYGIGFVLMVPLIFSVVYRYKLPALYIGLPMLAALSVTHGFLPPHPSPAALVVQFKADMGLTLLYGLAVSIPAIVIGGPIFSRTLKSITAVPIASFSPVELADQDLPSGFKSFFTALLPVILLAAASFLPLLLNPDSAILPYILFAGQPSVVMLIVLIAATWLLGLSQGKKITAIMGIYADAVKDIALILLIIAGSGALKQVLTESGVSNQIAYYLQHVELEPLFLAWLIAALIRFCVGSATVAGLTTAGIIAPLMEQTHTNPNLMVLAVGAGSLMFSHVNDAGFWMFKEYFGLSLKDTFKSWALMESIVGIVGLLGILLLHLIIA
ncbi:Gnt-I system high-affinity gluconate transporter [Pedobacter terrae]|uniref:Gnt-I system high-affinity gluconate transporter n=1 Tax=Pedobacter terrae TaxID=405671 RepID=A0A1G7YUK2_9SPHI|nr:gluconate:H+ symporter [Pedobacter terrae]SDH00025.1 Gnt-I system high-affinity gluconate transporter [Pedobacter terrae]